jgi:probable phosphoglycerate mutase
MTSLTSTPTLIFVRHGETAWNVAKRIQGHLDIPLNDHGRAQAQAVREALAHTPIHAVVSSPLQRARHTAQPLADHIGLPVEALDSLAERHFGVLQGQSFESMREQNLEAAHAWARRDPHYTPEGGESLHTFYARVDSAVQAVLSWAKPGSSVVVFTHGGVLDMVYRMAQQVSLSEPRAWGIPNGGLNKLAHQPDVRLQLLSWAEVHHLSHLVRSDAGASSEDHKPI